MFKSANHRVSPAHLPSFAFVGWPRYQRLVAVRCRWHPLTQEYFLRGNGGTLNNPLAAINPNDIESIEILKDAALLAFTVARRQRCHPHHDQARKEGHVVRIPAHALASALLPRVPI